MLIFNVTRDKHPGKHHVGMRLVLCKARCPQFSSRTFFCGFRPREDRQKHQGMFGPVDEPVQSMELTPGCSAPSLVMQMSNCGSLSIEQIDELYTAGILQVKYGQDSFLRIHVVGEAGG